MIKYIFAATVLILFFELLGQSVNSFFKVKHLPFNFFAGFITYLGILYVITMIPQRENCSFNFLLIVNVLLFVMSAFLIFKQRKEIKIRFKWYELVLLILMVCGMLHYTWITTLGDLDAFDSTFYINQVIGAIGKDHINNFSILYGNTESIDAVTVSYIFQSYFYFCSVIIYLFVKIANVLNIQTFYATAYIWIFQLIFSFSLMSIFVNSLKELLNRKYILVILLLLLFVFHYGRIYWFSVYGFYGNSFRTIVFAYISYYLIEWFNGENNYKWLVTLGILAACACSSTATYTSVFLIFGIVIVACDLDDKLFRWIGITMLFPLINLITFLTGRVYPSIGLSFALCLAIYALNKQLVTIMRTKYMRYIIVGVVTMLMFFMSYRVTSNIFDFSAFNDNLSEKFDMSLQYFVIDPVGYYKVLKILTVSSMIAYMVLFSKQKFSMLCWVLIICVFNPFCCSYLNSILSVYYRAYDIFFNPFTLIFYLSLLDGLLKKYYVPYILELVCIYFIYTTTNFVYPNRHHASFDPKENYDNINKITYTQTDILLELDRLTDKYNITNPEIMTSNTLSFGMIGKGVYYLCRESIPPYHYTINEKAYRVFAAFHPQEYFGQYTYDDIDLMRAPEYLLDSDVNFLVLDRDLDYYNDLDNYWGRIEDLLNERVGFPEYHNDDYAIYVINKD